MRTRRSLPPLVALAVGVAVLAIPSAAQAHKDGVCNSGDVCVWQDSGYSGGFLDYFTSDNDYRNDTFFVTGSVVDNRVTSLRNYDPNCKVQMYRAPGYSDPRFALYEAGSGSNDRWSNLVLIGHNDMLSSHSFYDC